jgi:hypothetical protein
MNKTELIERIAVKAELSKKDAKDALEAALAVIQEAVVNGDPVQLVGFGTFSSSVRAARNGRNPLTGEKMEIKAAKVPKFKAGKCFKDALNN